MRNLRPFVALLLLAVFSLSALGASRTKGKHTKPTPVPAHETVISTVSSTSLTIREDKAAKTFALTPFTEISVNGNRATIADLKAGMKVSVTLASNPAQLSRVSATGGK